MALVSPGHRSLRPDDSFLEIAESLECDAQVVDGEGQVLTLTAEVLRCSAKTAHLFGESRMPVSREAGGLALAPEVKHGWTTWSFTVPYAHSRPAGHRQARAAASGVSLCPATQGN